MKTQWKWLLLLLTLISPLTPWLDIKISSYFYTQERFSDHPYFTFLFTTGERFGFFVGGVACFFYFLSLFSKRHRHYRRGALMIGLTLVLGAGVMVNGLFKSYWGRPRPKQIEQFGGTLSYRPFWQPNFDSGREPQKSFPSGHVAMGFFYLSLIAVGKVYKNRFLYFSGIFLTLFWGGGLMIARIAQGGHFLSDVLASLLLMWLTTLVLAKYTLKESLFERNRFAADKAIENHEK